MTRAFTEHYRDGMRAAVNLTRAQANVYAAALPVAQGDAFLAGYYAERRRLERLIPQVIEDEDSDPAADRGDWRFHMDHDQ